MNGGELLLTSASWLPFADAVEILRRLLSSDELAVLRLEDGLDSGKLRSKLVALDDGRITERLITADEWRNGATRFRVSMQYREDDQKELTPDWRDEIEISLQGEADNPSRRVYVWRPDLEQMCGIDAPAAQPPARETTAASAPARQGEPQAKPRRKGSREQDLIKQFVAEKWPDGWELVSTRVIMKAADEDEEFKKKVRLHFPSRTTFERALGRRKD
jgi:hypothetical protein